MGMFLLGVSKFNVTDLRHAAKFFYSCCFYQGCSILFLPWRTFAWFSIYWTATKCRKSEKWDFPTRHLFINYLLCKGDRNQQTMNQGCNPCVTGSWTAESYLVGMVRGSHANQSHEHYIAAQIEVFVNNTNLTFVPFLYKISIEVF